MCVGDVESVYRGTSESGSCYPLAVWSLSTLLARHYPAGRQERRHLPIPVEEYHVQIFHSISCQNTGPQIP